MSDALLAVEAAQKSFGANQVLAGVQLTVRESEIVGLLGPNGSGKSTLLNVISGFSPADRGRIRFAGQDITGHAAHRIAANGLVRTFQLPAMPHRMTVREVVQAGRPAGHGVGPMLGRLAFDPEVDDLLEQFLLTHVADAPASSLSGGQKKLLSIATALRTSPRLLCLDEPTAGVHSRLRNEIVDLLRNWNARGLTILIVEHDMTFVRNLCRRCVVLDRGAIIADCAPDELADDARVVEAYLGKAGKRAGIGT